MNCKLCKSPVTEIIYQGPIRSGKVGNLLSESVNVRRCKTCGVIYHDFEKNLREYYESSAYRDIFDGATDLKTFYRLHDGENLNKFRITGTDIFRDKIVADIGCGGGGFLDFLAGVAGEIVAVEPSEAYRREMAKKGYHAFAYSSEAQQEYANGIDVIVSFDVIEHVEDPVGFLRDIYRLLKKDGGRAIIGTPTEAPLLRQFAGRDFDQKYLFNTEHLWIFDRQSLEYSAREAGFTNIRIKYLQRYGFGNFLNWIKTGEGKGNINFDSVPPELSSMFNACLEEQGLADYIVAYLEKKLS